MDGLKMVTPESCKQATETDLFGEVKKKQCKACEHGEKFGHVGIPCYVKNWSKDKDKQHILFSTLIVKS